MKNIHLIPTDKPSRLHLWTDENGTRPALCELEYSHTRNTQNIYITSYEEIKEGVDQWYLDKVLNEPYNSGGAQYSSKQDVIIMTTDPDLIKDGVQPISNEFLEWFVKNPSCEKVEVERGKMKLNDDGQEYGFPDMSLYKIIIPNEEPNQIKCYCGHTTMCDCSPIEEPKQETLEEAAEKYGSDFDLSFYDTVEEIPIKEFAKKDFIEGAKSDAARDYWYAKWQQERRYSEEEVRNLFRNYQYDVAQWVLRMEDDIDGKPIPTDWFEQNKKK